MTLSHFLFLSRFHSLLHLCLTGSYDLSLSLSLIFLLIICISLPINVIFLVISLNYRYIFNLYIFIFFSLSLYFFLSIRLNRNLSTPSRVIIALSFPCSFQAKRRHWNSKKLFPFEHAIVLSLSVKCPSMIWFDEDPAQVRDVSWPSCQRTQLDRQTSTASFYSVSIFTNNSAI